MQAFKQKHGLLVLGILIGAAYGVVTRLVFGERATLASITYLFLIPAILGVVPLVFASEYQVRSYRNIIFIPWITIATFFLTTVLVGMEEFLCLLILAGPFFILGTIGALIVRLIILHRRNSKLLAVMVLPFLFSPVEEAISSPSEIYKVESSVMIAASPERVWANIVEVPMIRDDEFSPGVFNHLGVPRPLSAEISAKEKGATRIGSFDGGLRFVETLIEFEPNERVSFSIVVDPDSVGPRVFDQHVLNGDYFAFIDAGYDIADAGDGHVRLTLTSRYQLTSKVNFYGKFWGDMILRDFQDRLLDVVRARSEQRLSRSFTFPDPGI
ncbi:MAG TPA: hypothetical protein PKD26_00495 [Pyrinomonadaceae bacterium]|nr:hypothetical protein [Pyrinomonadaceae bacterium]